ncbi:Histone lysine acetyltransferase CREBBP [Halotydeus destructor]|nr:Histone lysine acetyltransferase CREBBP [Halotydeus destructor]
MEPIKDMLGAVGDDPAVAGAIAAAGDHESGGDASGTATTSGESKRLSIQRCLQSLVHACQCRNANCCLPHCDMLKRAVQHARTCKRGAGNQAQTVACRCKQLMALCYVHAKSCNEAKCLVPNCIKYKEKKRSQQQQLVEGKDNVSAAISGNISGTADVVTGRGPQPSKRLKLSASTGGKMPGEQGRQMGPGNRPLRQQRRTRYGQQALRGPGQNQVQGLQQTSQPLFVEQLLHQQFFRPLQPICGKRKAGPQHTARWPVANSVAASGEAVDSTPSGSFMAGFTLATYLQQQQDMIRNPMRHDVPLSTDQGELQQTPGQPRMMAVSNVQQQHWDYERLLFVSCSAAIFAALILEISFYIRS